MAIVTIDIGGFQYDVTCRDGGQAQLIELARVIDAKVSAVRASIGAASEVRQLLMAALMLADEVSDARLAPAVAASQPPQQADAMEVIAARLERLATRLEKQAADA